MANRPLGLAQFRRDQPSNAKRRPVRRLKTRAYDKQHRERSIQRRAAQVDVHVRLFSVRGTNELAKVYLLTCSCMIVSGTLQALDVPLYKALVSQWGTLVELREKQPEKKDGSACSGRDDMDSTGCRDLVLPGSGDVETMALQLVETLESYCWDRGS